MIEKLMRQLRRGFVFSEQQFSFVFLSHFFMKASSKLAGVYKTAGLWLLLTGSLLITPSLWADDTSDTNSFAAAPTDTSTNVDLETRRLQPNDVLDMNVFQQPDMTTRVSIDNQGMVVLPLLGPVKFGGLTLEQATDLVQNLYNKDYLVDPKVTLQMVQYAVLRYTILGQVQRPGTYEFPPNENLNLLDGVATAGGFTRLAQSSRVTIRRNVNGVLKVFTVDAKSMAVDRQHKPLMLNPGDTITVEERVF